MSVIGTRCCFWRLAVFLFGNLYEGRRVLLGDDVISGVRGVLVVHLGFPLGAAEGAHSDSADQKGSHQLGEIRMLHSLAPLW